MSDKETAVKTITLSKPLKDPITQLDLNELNFQEMTVEDFIEMKQTDFLEVKSIIYLTSKLTGVEQKVFNKMSPKDYFNCANVINGFFGFSQET